MSEAEKTHHKTSSHGYSFEQTATGSYSEIPDYILEIISIELGLDIVGAIFEIKKTDNEKSKATTQAT
jgi:hypothetical protein